MDLLKNTVTGAVGAATGVPLSTWHDGICDCMGDTGMCIQTWCCIYCTLANIQNKRDNNIGAFDIGACCAIMWGSYITGSDIIPWMAFAFRRELVQKYHIGDETVCKSCCLAACCSTCTLCQVQREMAKRGDHAGGCCANPPPPSASTMAQGAVNSAVGATLGNVLGGVLGGVTNTLHSGHLPHPWNSGLCQCDLMDCCEGFWCYCCIFGFMGNRLNAGRTPEVPLGAPNVMDPITCCSALWYPFGHIYANRREVIQRYNVTGESHTMTCLYTLCCPICSTIQQRREMGYCGEWPGGLLVKTAPAAPLRAPM